ncbi:MAG: OB-fold nucleic acid binding domain-containing protein [Thermoplasmatota archaeon]
MNRGDTRQYLLLAAAVVCIAGLYLVGTASEPSSISLADLDEHEGETVQAAGLVVHVQRYSQAASFVLRNGSVSARVFSPHGADIRQGDRVRVTGTVQRYQGRLEIMADNVTVLASAIRMVPLSVLAGCYDDFLGATVTVNGSAARVGPEMFRLADGSHSIEVRHPEQACNLTAGIEVSVTGTLRYDPDILCFYLSIERDDHWIARRG